MAIEFDVEELIGRVDAITATQLPFAARRAMFSYANILRKEAWPAYSKVNFENPVPFTTSGLFAKADGLTVTLSFDRDAPKGQDPSRYLAPTETGGEIYVTRFSRAIKNNGIMPSAYAYAAPNTRSSGFAGEINEYGNIKSGFYKAVLAALKRKPGAKTRSKYRDYRFFSVPDGRRPSRANQRLKPGIYRQKSREPLQKLFGYLENKPTVSKRWDFNEFAEISGKELLPGLLDKYISEAFR